MIRAAIVVAVSISVGLTAPARAQEDDPVQNAQAALDAREFASAETIASSVLSGQLQRSVRAEAWRIVGLSRFYLKRLEDAELAFVEYLKLDADADLDPALHPPDTVVFFANVRARHRGEIDKAKPTVESRRYIVNFFPPLGQFQNGHRTKGWIIVGVGLTLAGAQLASYLTIRRWCGPSGSDCDGRKAKARRLQIANVGFGIALLGTYIYGVVDGVHHHRKWERERRGPKGSFSLLVVPTHDGGLLGASLRF